MVCRQLSFMLVFKASVTGPNIQALGTVNTGEIYIEPLSSSVPLYFNEFDSTSMEILIRFMSALHHLFHSLHMIYQKPADHTVDVDQVNFPYVCSYKSFSGTLVPFKYVERISNVRLVFATCTQNNQQIIVKLDLASMELKFTKWQHDLIWPQLYWAILILLGDGGWWLWRPWGMTGPHAMKLPPLSNLART